MIVLMSQFQKYWFRFVDNQFSRTSKPYWRTNSDFFSQKAAKNQISGRFPPLPSTRDILYIQLSISA